MPGFAHAREPEYDEKTADVEARELNDPGFGMFVRKVQKLSGSPIHATENIAGVLRRCHIGGEATTSSCSCHGGAVPNITWLDEKGKAADLFFFFF